MANVTLRGNPVNLVGNEVKVGDTAPDFKIQKSDLHPAPPVLSFSPVTAYGECVLFVVMSVM